MYKLDQGPNIMNRMEYVDQVKQLLNCALIQVQVKLGSTYSSLFKN